MVLLLGAFERRSRRKAIDDVIVESGAMQFIPGSHHNDVLAHRGQKGDPLPYNPKWQSTIGADFEYPLNGTITGRAGLSWHYTGSRRSDFDPINGQRKLGGFSQLDAQAGLDFGRVRVDAFAHNITDARGIVNIGFFGSPTADLAASVIRPRSFGLTLSMRN